MNAWALFAAAFPATASWAVAAPATAPRLASAAAVAPVAARARDFKVAGWRIGLDVPEGWSVTEASAQAPLTLQSQSALSVLALEGADGPLLDVTARERLRYESARRDWLGEEGGRAIEFFPNRRLAGTRGSEVYTFGVRYELDGREFLEQAYYVRCGRRTYYLQALVPFAAREEDEVIERVARSLECAIR